MEELQKVINKWAEQNAGKPRRYTGLRPMAFDDSSINQSVDCLGNTVDYQLTYGEFIREYSKYCHSFNKNGCLLNEGGCWGLSNMIVGFQSKQDLKMYRKWLKVNNKMAE